MWSIHASRSDIVAGTNLEFTYVNGAYSELKNLALPMLTVVKKFSSVNQS
jgi:hypothetical protein